MTTPPPAGASPAHTTGWNDAATGEPLPASASPAHATDYNNYHAQNAS